MNDGLLADHLAEADLQRVEAVWQASGTNFVQLAELAGLDRASAWRHLNLSGTDFTDCDLRGFDFTGADLRGCTGSNVTVDDTTILRDAELGASIFELAAATAEVLRDRPDLQREYGRIKRAHWTDQHNWVFDILNGKVREPEARRTLALSLYFDATDPFVRRTILYFLIFKTQNTNEALGFLARFISEAAQDTDAIVSALLFLSKTYRRSEQSMLLLFAIAEDESRDVSVRSAAMAGLLINEAATRHLPRASALVKRFKNRTLDNLYIRLIAGQISYFHVLVVGAGKPIGGINFQDSIDEIGVLRIVAGLWGVRNEEAASTCLQFHAAPTMNDLVAPVVDCLQELRTKGLLLKLEFSTEVLAAIYLRRERPNSADFASMAL